MFLQILTLNSELKFFTRGSNPLPYCCLCFRVLSKNCSRSLAVFSPWSWETTRAALRSRDPSCPSSLNQLPNRCALSAPTLMSKHSFIQTFIFTFYVLRVVFFTSCVCSFQGFKVGYIVFQNSSSLTAAKSHPHNVPLVVSTEQRPVRTGVQSEWHCSDAAIFINVKF